MWLCFDNAQQHMDTQSNQPPQKPTSMMTVSEVAAIIRKSPYTVRKLASKRVIPGGRRVGREWLFQRAAIERFAGISK